MDPVRPTFRKPQVTNNRSNSIYSFLTRSVVKKPKKDPGLQSDLRKKNPSIHLEVQKSKRTLPIVNHSPKIFASVFLNYFRLKNFGRPKVTNQQRSTGSYSDDD